MKARITECIKKEEQETTVIKREGPRTTYQQRINAWFRMVRLILNLISHANQEYAANYLMTRHSLEEMHEEDRARGRQAPTDGAREGAAEESRDQARNWANRFLDRSPARLGSSSQPNVSIQTTICDREPAAVISGGHVSPVAPDGSVSKPRRTKPSTSRRQVQAQVKSHRRW